MLERTGKLLCKSAILYEYHEKHKITMKPVDWPKVTRDMPGNRTVGEKVGIAHSIDRRSKRFRRLDQNSEYVE
jgi:hypothetical protein